MARFAFGWTLPVRHQKQEKEPMPIYKNIKKAASKVKANYPGIE